MYSRYAFNFIQLMLQLPQKSTLSTHLQIPTTENQNLLPPPPPSPSMPLPSPQSLKRLGPYEFCINRRIGSGMTGDAYVGMNTQTFELVCVKVVDRKVFKTAQQQRLLENEIRCQRACNSPYTVSIFDVFDTTSFCFIVTQFCDGGDLYRCLRASPKGLSQELVVQFGREIARALLKLKEAGIVHRDIKSENILIQKSACKLGDFGFAVEQKALWVEKKFNLGSPLYMSIQALQFSQYSFASDVFAFGVVLYEMLHKESPWECADEKELLEKMKNEEVVFKKEISEDLQQLIRNCLSKKAEERPSIEQILNCPLFSRVDNP